MKRTPKKATKKAAKAKAKPAPKKRAAPAKRAAVAPSSLGQAPIDRVRAVYACFGGGDLPGLLAQLAEDVIWISPGPATIPHAGLRRGRAAVAEWFKVFADAVELDWFDVDRIFADGQIVVAIGHERGFARATGRRFETAFAHVWTVSGDEVVAFRDTLDTAAIAAAFEPR